jgi:hypothetical protein
MGEKERKQLMVAIPLLVVALFMVFWFIIKPQLGGGETAPTTTTTAPPEAVPGTGMPPGAPGGPVPGAVEVAAGPREYEPSQEAARGDPFVSYTKIKVIPPPDPKTLFKMLRPKPTIPPVPVTPTEIMVIGEEIEEQHDRRMAGMLHNGRVWAIYERDGVGLVVKPGDPVQDETVIAITKDYIVLRSLDGRERKVPLERMTGYETTGGYAPGPGPGPYAPGPTTPRPPGPPRPPGMM